MTKPPLPPPSILIFNIGSAFGNDVSTPAQYTGPSCTVVLVFMVFILSAKQWLNRYASIDIERVRLPLHWCGLFGGSLLI